MCMFQMILLIETILLCHFYTAHMFIHKRPTRTNKHIFADTVKIRILMERISTIPCIFTVLDPMYWGLISIYRQTEAPIWGQREPLYSLVAQ